MSESIPRRMVSAVGLSVAAVGAALLVLWCLLIAYIVVVGGLGLLWDLIRN